MESSTESKEPRDSQRVLMTILIAALVISSGLVVYVVYVNRTSNDIISPRAIQIGDQVKMNYTGRFPFPDGRIFDTSILSVATDNALYPKSLTFSLRTNDSYKPFTMTAGNYGSGGTIKGFAMGVIGLHEGDHKFIYINPEDAYPVNENMVETHPVVQQVPATELMTTTEFTSTYSRDPVVLSVFPHYFWGWNVTILDVSAGVVALKHQPTVGEVVYPFGNPNNPDSPAGWPVVVESYDPAADGGFGVTTVRHLVSESDVYRVKGVFSDGTTFILSGFDETNETFQINMNDSTSGYNGEIAGRALVFEIWIISVVPSQS